MVLDQDGLPYVIFTDRVEEGDQTIEGIVKVMKFNGTEWEIVGNENITLNQQIFAPSITVIGETPYVLFQHPTSEFASENDGKASVMKYQQ